MFKIQKATLDIRMVLHAPLQKFYWYSNEEN